jgi:hypothetical protein
MPYRAGDVRKPSELLDDLLSGKTAWDDADEAIRSWARIAIYEAADMVLQQPDQGARRNMLGKIPAQMRPRVEAEVMRLFALRKGRG